MKVRRLFLFALLLIVLALVGGVVLISRWFAVSIMHPARLPLTALPSDAGIGAWQDITLTTADGVTLAGWYIAPSAAAAPGVILVHGNGGNRTSMLRRAAFYAERGYGILLFDLRAHGASGGSLTTLGYVERADVIAAFDFMQRQPAVNPDSIILHGESMGGAAVIRAAALLPEARAVIVESTFSTLEENIANGVRHATGLPPFPFAPLILFFCEQEAGARMHDLRPVDEIGAVAPRPLLIMHGELDALVAVDNAHALYAAAGEPKTLVIFPSAGHSGLYAADPVTWESHVTALLEQAR